MTEAGWLACEDPLAALAFLGQGAGGRKLRLFAAACCRRIWSMLDTIGQGAVEAADGCCRGAVSTQHAWPCWPTPWRK
jgi:hypothetical protein